MSRPTEMILAEMNDLDAAGLIGVRNSDGDLTRVTSTAGGLGGFQPSLTGTDLTKVQLTEIGVTLYRLMELDRIPDETYGRSRGPFMGNAATCKIAASTIGSAGGSAPWGACDGTQILRAQ